MRVVEWKWIRVSVIEVVERKNGIVFNENEWKTRIHMVILVEKEE